MGDEQPTTRSGIELKPVYGPADLPADDRYRRAPGTSPYVRGAYAGMYRTQPWRIFQLSGFGNPEDEGERIRFLLEHGETGFIMEHDRNTADHLYNVDHPSVVARQEDVGRTGAVILSVRDYATVLEGIPLDKTYAHPGGGVVQHGPFALACYWTLAQRRGHQLSDLYGTGQSDFFLTYVGCPPEHQIPATSGLRLNGDIIEFCAAELPHWVPVSIAGYNGAETGLNAYQELGAVIANAVEYLDLAKARGRVPVESLARGVGGVNFRTSMDLFEDVAKLRAARWLWADVLAERYGITDERLSQLRIHSLTAGSAMTYQQPLNNIVRGTVMALAGVLGGTQSLGVSGYDEALSVPSEHAQQMSLRIQQVLQNEVNLRAVADPLGGSYFVESLTRDIYERGHEFLDQILEQGGFIAALDAGWLHRRAMENQITEARSTDVAVGVDAYLDDVWPGEIDGFEGTTDAWERGIERLAELRRVRDSRGATDALRALDGACRGDDNVMPAMLDAVAADVTLGEIGDVYRDAFGDWPIPVQL